MTDVRYNDLYDLTSPIYNVACAIRAYKTIGAGKTSPSPIAQHIYARTVCFAIIVI